MSTSTPTELPSPFKTEPNAWELGYYHGYNGLHDLEMWNHPTLSPEYKKGWCEGHNFHIIEYLIQNISQDPKDK